MTVPRFSACLNRMAAMASGFALALASLATAAHAADIGHCDTPEGMAALLKTEGQRSLAYGNRQIIYEKLPDGQIRDARGQQRGLIFTADTEGKVGYMLQADQPIGTRAAKMCVAERFHNVRFYDVRKPGLPPEALLKSTEADAARRCDQIAAAGTVKRGACGFHNTVMQKSEAVGERVMILGLGVRKQPDGSWTPDGNLITVTANMTGDGTSRDGRGAVQFTVLPEGAVIIASVFTGSAYAEAALQILARRP